MKSSGFHFAGLFPFILTQVKFCGGLSIFKLQTSDVTLGGSVEVLRIRFHFLLQKQFLAV